MSGILRVARADGEHKSSSDLLQVRRAEQLLQSSMLFAAWLTQYEQQGQHYERTNAP